MRVCDANSPGSNPTSGIFSEDFFSEIKFHVLDEWSMKKLCHSDIRSIVNCRSKPWNCCAITPSHCLSGVWETVSAPREQVARAYPRTLLGWQLMTLVDCYLGNRAFTQDLCLTYVCRQSLRDANSGEITVPQHMLGAHTRRRRSCCTHKVQLLQTPYSNWYH